MSSSYEYEFKWFSYVRFYQTYLPQIGLVSDYFLLLKRERERERERENTSLFMIAKSRV